MFSGRHCTTSTVLCRSTATTARCSISSTSMHRSSQELVESMMTVAGCQWTHTMPRDAVVIVSDAAIERSPFLTGWHSMPHVTQPEMPSSSPDLTPSNNASTVLPITQRWLPGKWCTRCCIETIDRSTASQCRMLADGFSQCFTDKLDHIGQSITISLQQITEPDYSGRDALVTHCPSCRRPLPKR